MFSNDGTLTLGADRQAEILQGQDGVELQGWGRI